MNCKNCGTPLMGMEHACPVCGAPLPTTPPQQVAQPAMPGVPMPEQLASQPPQMMPGGAPPAGLPAEQAPQPEPKKGNNIFAILLLLVAFAAIGVGVFLAMTDEEEKQAPAEEKTPAEETTPAEEVPTNTMNYAGYSFTAPEGYTVSLQGENGLVIKGISTIYTVLVDYTSGYDYYKQEFQKQTMAPTEVKTIGEKEYVLCTVKDATEAVASEYMTLAGEKSTFVGLVVKANYTAATEADLQVLNQVLTSAIKQTEITPGAAEDAGKTEIVNYISKFNKDNFTF